MLCMLSTCRSAGGLLLPVQQLWSTIGYSTASEANTNPSKRQHPLPTASQHSASIFPDVAFRLEWGGGGIKCHFGYDAHARVSGPGVYLVIYYQSSVVHRQMCRVSPSIQMHVIVIRRNEMLSVNILMDIYFDYYSVIWCIQHLYFAPERAKPTWSFVCVCVCVRFLIVSDL